MRDPIELGGYVAACFIDGECLYLPLAVFDQISSQYEAALLGTGPRVWRGETLSGCSAVIDLLRLETVVEVTAADVTRRDAFEEQRKAAEKLEG